MKHIHQIYARSWLPMQHAHNFLLNYVMEPIVHVLTEIHGVVIGANDINIVGNAHEKQGN
jgi:hypothetical protein